MLAIEGDRVKDMQVERVCFSPMLLGNKRRHLMAQRCGLSSPADGEIGGEDLGLSGYPNSLASLGSHGRYFLA